MLIYLSFLFLALKKKISRFPQFPQKEKHIYLRKRNQRYYKINNKRLLFHTLIYKNYEISN